METIYTVGQLREALKDFLDEDQLVLETIDERGDEDLYPFHIDVIDGIQLIDENGNNTIVVKEIRFCQESHYQVEYLNKYKGSTYLGEKITRLEIYNGLVIVHTETHHVNFFIDVNPKRNYSADYIICMIQDDSRINVSKY